MAKTEVKLEINKDFKVANVFGPKEVVDLILPKTPEITQGEAEQILKNLSYKKDTQFVPDFVTRDELGRRGAALYRFVKRD